MHTAIRSKLLAVVTKVRQNFLSLFVWKIKDTCRHFALEDPDIQTAQAAYK